MRSWFIGAAIVAACVAAGVAWYYQGRPDPLVGFASGNGRIEATEIDIAAKNHGRIAEILAHEGDWVEVGQMVARMDIRTLQAELKQAEARVEQARNAMLSASAMVAQRRTELEYAKIEFGRSVGLLTRGFITREHYDKDNTRKLIAAAALRSAQALEIEAASAIEAEIAEVERIRAELDDSVLKSPCDCRVLYRLAEPGEVLGAGGRVLTVLNLTDVSMSIYLPTHQATQVALGAEARIVLDALPDLAVPAKVTFVAARSQFTPREVETRTEREKLMFRVKVRIPPDLLERHKQQVKTGVPGVAYVRLDEDVPWPPELQPPADL